MVWTTPYRRPGESMGERLWVGGLHTDIWTKHHSFRCDDISAQRKKKGVRLQGTVKGSMSILIPRLLACKCKTVGVSFEYSTVVFQCKFLPRSCCSNFLGLPKLWTFCGQRYALPQARSAAHVELLGAGRRSLSFPSA